MKPSTNPRTIPQEPHWIRWLHDAVRVLKEGGMLVMPGPMLIYRVSHQEKTLTLVNAPPGYDKEEKVTVITERCAEVLGYRVIYPEAPKQS
jgi:hypothetical protein